MIRNLWTQMPTKKLSDKSKSFVRSYWAALLWAAFILVVCSLPGYDLPNLNFWDIDYIDKLEHMTVFAILGFLMVYGFDRHYFGMSISPSTKVLWGFIILASAFGGFTEILQGLFFPTRFADVFDFVADSLGGVLGTILGNLYFKYRTRI